jgi:Flp pilus assembly pilin Flp
MIRFYRDEEGVVMIEYGLIAALIGAALIIILGLLTNSIQDMFNRIISTLTNA